MILPHYPETLCQVPSVIFTQRKISLTQFCSLYVKSNKTGTDFKIKIAHSDSLCLVCAAGIL